MDLSAYRGIQHRKLSSIPKLTSIGNDDAVRLYCCEKCTYLGGGWRSNDFLLVFGPGAPKQRCVKCTSAHSNIRPARHPNLFPERTAVAADTTNRAVPIPQLILPNLDAEVSTHKVTAEEEIKKMIK